MPKAVRGLSSGSSRSSAAPPATTSQSERNLRRDQQEDKKQDRRLAPGGTEQTFESKEDDSLTRGDSMHDLPKWLEEFTEYLVDWEASTPEGAG